MFYSGTSNIVLPVPNKLSFPEAFRNKSRLWNIACEFSHSSWYHTEIYKLLRLYDISMVLHDMPSVPPLRVEGSGFVYIRFHGPDKAYQGSYTNDFLDAYAKRIKIWIDEGKEVYAYSNNTLGDAVNNLITLNRYADR